ncbi:MAG TPA: protease complex subunit PrcB family protein [Firmicutes bacterium]|nr:protease complex subunit PrcB family protein [Candidatus Fermentithermobacillaceae bacterium]
MRKTSGTRTWTFKAVLLVALIFLAAAMTACKAKDIVSLAKLDKGDLYVADKYGNSVMVGNPRDIIDVLKKAQKVKGGSAGDSFDPSKASHTLWSGQEKVYYDWDSKQAVVVDSKGNKTVFSVDLNNLLLAIPGLPPMITEGPGGDPAITSGFAEISKVDAPSAAVFRTGDKAIVMVAAGKRPTGGYTMSLEDVSVGIGGVVELTVRLNPPSGPADDAITYPYLELSMAKYVDLEITLISTVDGRERPERVNLAVVEPEQEIVVFKPDRGALLTERVQMYGFAKWDVGSFTVTVHDGHSVLGSKTVKVTHSLRAGAQAPTWGAFNFIMDLQPAKSPSGMVEFAKGSEVLVRVPVSFGGK